MVEALAHELDDMVVIEGVEGFLADLAELHQPGCAQYAQLV